MIKRLVASLGLLVLLLAPAAPASAAYNVFQGVDSKCSSTVAGSAVCSSRADPLTGTQGVIYKVANVIAVLTGIAAVIVIIISGFQFITSGGDAQKAAGARRSLLGAIIGLVIVIAARSIIIFVLNRV